MVAFSSLAPDPESLSILGCNSQAIEPFGAGKVHDLNDPIMGDIAVRPDDKRHGCALCLFNFETGFEFFNSRRCFA